MIENNNFFIENLPFYNDLDDSDKEYLFRNTTNVTYKKGEIVHDDTKGCTGLIMLEEGHFRVFYNNDGEKQITLFRLFSRDICVLSAPCILRNVRYNVSISADVDSKCIKINPTAYEKLSEKNAKVSRFTLDLLSSRLKDIMWVIEQVVFMSLDKRLATFLDDQSNITGSNDINITHDCIAKNIGSAREVVTRMLKYFASENIVSLSRGTISIINKDKLELLL